MATTPKPHIGDLPPSYNFMLNPYPHQRLSRCAICGQKTGQRKIPLLIHIEPLHMIALNYTCRFCKDCDLLIAHKDEIEHLLTGVFSQYDPEAIGNNYLIIGTVEKNTWREGLERPKAVAEMLPHASDFATYEEPQLTRPGYYKSDQEPPIWEPPLSQEWIKVKSDRMRQRSSRKLSAPTGAGRRKNRT